jgi:hypothetical protein
MSRTLKGGGAHKRELLDKVREKFGDQNFQYHEISKWVCCTRSIFDKLVLDKMFIKMSKSSPYLYRLSNAAFKTRSPDTGGDQP